MTDDALSAQLILEYPFTRTTGPVIGAFLTGLREKVLIGIKRADGTVMCPPLEYDPATAEPLTELVELPSTGTVTTWSWNGVPRRYQPFDRPFAWAMIAIDGTSVPMMHAVFVDDAEAMSTGMRVQVVWADERQGHITDVAGFVPEEQT